MPTYRINVLIYLNLFNAGIAFLFHLSTESVCRRRLHSSCCAHLKFRFWLLTCIYVVHHNAEIKEKFTVYFTVPCLRRLDTCLSSWRLWFATRSVHVRFEVDKVALGQVLLRVFCFPLSVSFHWCFILISHGWWTVGPLLAAVQRHSPSPSSWTTTWMPSVEQY
jgi:hypothetical protein